MLPRIVLRAAASVKLPRLETCVKYAFLIAGWLLCLATAGQSLIAQEPAAARKLFARENLVAWCIVPFDAKKRGPEERAAMLKKLGFSKFAYDYRAEHIPTFDAEMDALKKQGIELVAWWFPGALNDEARGILDVLKRHDLKIQLWVTGGGEPTKSADEQRDRVRAEAARIQPIAEAAAKIGCSVALYNHGGWFGEPENQLAILEELKLPNVGIVYNLHHGHDHLERFPALLKRMLPHLVCLNLNGMYPDGERRGAKIVPLGQGELDLTLLQTIAGSGYRGPIGILGHTQDDAEERLQDNLDGLDWLVKQLDGLPPGPQPKPRTPVPQPAPPKPAAAKQADAKTTRPIENHWGRAVIGFDWQESDSVDNRWNKTDVGPFLASILPLPQSGPAVPAGHEADGGANSRRLSDGDRRTTLIEKGLSIKLGDRGQGAVVYDTERMTLRAGWTGGFLKFDPARYGLIHSPQIAGEIAFASPLSAGWEAKQVRYLGLHLNRSRVVLAAEIDGALVRDSPWLEQHGEVTIFTRTIEVAPRKDPLVCLVGTFAGEAKTSPDGLVIVRSPSGQSQLVIGLAGDGKLTVHSGQQNEIRLLLPGGNDLRRCKLLICSAVSSAKRAGDVIHASPPPENLLALSAPGPPHWTAEIVTRGIVSPDQQSPYVVDTLTLPFDNPYKALLFVSGHDFFAGGDIAICTVHGDVWRVSGVDESLGRLVWKRFATGLFQPLGLKIVADQVYVLGRDQITRLVDHNQDGEADEYQCFTNAYQTSASGHDFVTCLEIDSHGRFHFLHATEGLLRVSPDGQQVECVATGFRNPNGMGIGPGDVITVSPQEGEWTPGSMIDEVRAGGHYGYGGPKPGHGSAGHDPPMAWVPRMMDNSSGGQVWATSNGWGPLGSVQGSGFRVQQETRGPDKEAAGHLLHFSYGKCRLLLVLRERVGQVVQGAVVEVPGVSFASGAMRGRFSPRDGQLYVSGLKGWASAAVDDGCLQRVRYTGRPLTIPVNRKTYANGLAITLSQPLDPATAEDPGSYHLEQWNYRYAAAYGSPDLKVSDPAVEGHDEVSVRSATLLDPSTVFLEIEGLRPADQTSIEYSLRTAQNEPLRQTLVATTHLVPAESIDAARLHRREHTGEVVDEGNLAPGVILRFSQGPATATRAGRLVAWSVPSGQSAGGSLAAGPFEATATGYVKVPLRGEYRFHFTGSGAASLRLNGRPVLPAAGDLSQAEPASVTLHQGYNRLEVAYTSPGDGAGSCRLWWTDGTFAAEPVPPTALWHEERDESLQAADQLRRGAWLAGERHCVACHDVPGVKRPVTPGGPSLVGIGSRVELQWIYEWLFDPAAIRPQAHMPRLFAADQPADRQAAADIAAYLATLRQTGPSSQPEGLADRSAGAALFEDLGCVACHRLTPAGEQDAYDRLPLAHVPAKFQPGKLAEFLRHPQAHFPQTRMPDFALSPSEAQSLAEYLVGGEQVKLPAAEELATADAKRGQAMFGQLRCHACHATSHMPIAPQIEPIALTQLTRGCLANEPASRGKAPQFSLTIAEMADVRAYFSRRDSSAAAAAPVEMLPQLLASLRCGACHNRDHDAAPLRRIIAEESEQGIVPDSLPSLTWTGEKLRTHWLHKQLAGELSYRSRPWLKARMPAFPSYAPILSKGLAAEHGLVEAETARAAVDSPELAALGDRLTRKEGGLDCRSCHAVGREQPTGDERTKVAQGINFAHVRERLRDDFYLRFVLDPPRHDLTTRMPKLSADGRTTNAKAILGGDARRQFEAIWQFIQTVSHE